MSQKTPKIHTDDDVFTTWQMNYENVAKNFFLSAQEKIFTLRCQEQCMEEKHETKDLQFFMHLSRGVNV